MRRESKRRPNSTKESSQFGKAAARAGIAAQSGKGAIKAEYRATISTTPPWTHTECIDLDAHFEREEPNACRWDYGVGIKDGTAELLVWVEPHPASSTGEVKRLVDKVNWLRAKLNTPAFKELSSLTDATVSKGHSAYRWLHAGALQIARGSKEARALARAGIEFPTRQIKLPS
jgi:hypothetical protein